MESLQEQNKINSIDTESLLCTYEGHTVFSLFFDRIRVYEQILAQLQEMEFEPQEDVNGLEVENGYLRRLYRTLNVPTADLLGKDGKDETKNTSSSSKGRQNTC